MKHSPLYILTDGVAWSSTVTRSGILSHCTHSNTCTASVVIALAHVRTQYVTCDAVCLPFVIRSVCLCVVIRLVPFGTLRTHGIVSVSVVMALHSNM